MRGFVRLPLGTVTLRLHLLVPVVAAGLWLVRPDLGLGYLLLLGSVLAHEVGHATASLLLGGRTAEIRIWPIFALANVPRIPGRRQALVALAGPLANLLVAGLCYVLVRPQGLQFSAAEPGSFLVTVNLVFALGNLIPVPPLDGGRVLLVLAGRDAPPPPETAGQGE